jgi:ABC-type Na+ efflux pump permease subunit
MVIHLLLIITKSLWWVTGLAVIVSFCYLIKKACDNFETAMQKLGSGYDTAAATMSIVGVFAAGAVFVFGSILFLVFLGIRLWFF